MEQVKNSKMKQSFSNEKKCEQTTSRVETPKYTNNNDGEINASDINDQGNEL